MTHFDDSMFNILFTGKVHDFDNINYSSGWSHISTISSIYIYMNISKQFPYITNINEPLMSFLSNEDDTARKGKTQCNVLTVPGLAAFGTETCKTPKIQRSRSEQEWGKLRATMTWYSKLRKIRRYITKCLH